MNIESFVNKINSLLTPKRMKYPYLVGALLWIGWIISTIAGKGNTDLAGNLFGTDFVAFYTAGKIILMGRGTELYNLDLAYSIQQTLSNNQNIGFYPYLNPPQYALFMVPFSLLPYPWAPLIWIILGIFCLYSSITILTRENFNRILLLSLTWLPVFSTASFGQNSFITLLLFSVTYSTWIRKRYFLSGVVYSMLLYKPQFLIALIPAWFFDNQKKWPQLFGFIIGALIQIALILILIPEAGLSYISYFQSTILNLSEISSFPVWHAFSVNAFWDLLLPNVTWLSRTLYIICIIISTYFYITLSARNGGNLAINCSLGILWLIWIVPYIMIYDWTLLLFPAILLWKHYIDLRPLLKACASVIWISSFISVVLTKAQLLFLPFAIQLSVLGLGFVIITIYTSLNNASKSKSEC